MACHRMHAAANVLVCRILTNVLVCRPIPAMPTLGEADRGVLPAAPPPLCWRPRARVAGRNSSVNHHANTTKHARSRHSQSVVWPFVGLGWVGLVARLWLMSCGARRVCRTEAASRSTAVTSRWPTAPHGRASPCRTQTRTPHRNLSRRARRKWTRGRRRRACARDVI
jgi:hypothetical protein